MSKTLIALFFAFILITACDQKQGDNGDNDSSGEVNADIVQNNNTANEDGDNANNDGVERKAVIKWDKLTHDFGKIAPNEQKQTIFRFQNVGNMPLIIKDVSTSCGCTVPEKPEKPIQPGEFGNLPVTFSKGPGTYRKQITVVSNAVDSEKYLHITAEVVEEDKETK